MNTYRQYHEKDNITFNTETKIYFGQTDVNRNLRLSQVFQYCSDFATDDFAQRGIPSKVMNQKGFAMLVSRASFRIHRLPAENEEIVITTREEKPEAIQLVRIYEFKTTAGELLITGKSLWLFCDPETRRIIPVSKFNLRPAPEVQNEHDCLEPGKIKIPQELQKIGEQKILRSHLDANHHLTNSKYPDLITDFLPEEYASKQIKDIRLNYCKEAHLGDTVELWAAFEEHKVIIAGKNNGQTCFESELYY